MSNKGKVKKKAMLTQMDTSHLQHRKDSVKEGGFHVREEPRLEIECPRCYDTMTLCSDFNGLYYFCEQCGFLLHTQK